PTRRAGCRTPPPEAVPRSRNATERKARRRPRRVSNTRAASRRPQAPTEPSRRAWRRSNDERLQSAAGLRRLAVDLQRGRDRGDDAILRLCPDAQRNDIGAARDAARERRDPGIDLREALVVLDHLGLEARDLPVAELAHRHAAIVEAVVHLL